MRKYTLECVAFFSGAAVMILELVGSRVLAPYVGVSLFVWTALIGIILGSLSIGYWYGGKLADRKPDYKTLSNIIVLAAFWIGAVALFKEEVLGSIRDATDDIRVSAILGALFLFAAPSVLLGMVSPYAVRLKMRAVTASGETVGNLYAISTTGSIAGTFAAGFFLIPHLGNANILLSVGIGLILTAILAHAGKRTIAPIALLILFAGGFPLLANIRANQEKQGFIDRDTRYNRIIITEGIDIATGRPKRDMTTDALGTQSAMFTDKDDDLVFPYTKFYRLAAHFTPRLAHTLMIGGGGYSYPKDYLKRFPEATMDVVEIDSGITALAKEYFNLPETNRLRIFHTDGRTFLNAAKETYDAIFIDAFKSYSPPYELTTREAISRMHARLNQEGGVYVNIISSIAGPKGAFLRAEYATFRSVFPQVYFFPVRNPKDPLRVQNIMLIALKSKEPPSFQNADKELQSYLKNRWSGEVPDDAPILTDEYAPVDYYMLKLLARE